MIKTVDMGSNRRYSYEAPWSGGHFTSSREQPIAFDVETELIQGREVPRLALISVAATNRRALLRPDQLPAFLVAHAGEHFVGHNVAFDFWVVAQWLKTNDVDVQNGRSLSDLWWRVVADGRFFDTMLLDMLVRLAKGVVAEIKPRNLALVSKDYGGSDLSKKDPYRLRYGELIGLPSWDGVAEGFFLYAIKDAIATAQAYPLLAFEAAGEMRRAGHGRQSQSFDVWSDAQRRWGYLSEVVQVRGAVALAQIAREGIRVDQETAARQEAVYRAELEGIVETFKRDYARVLKWKKQKRLKAADVGAAEQSLRERYRLSIPAPVLQYSAKSKTPSISLSNLRRLLVAVADEIGVKPPVSDGKQRLLSASAKTWEQVAGRHPFLKAWIRMAHVAKLLGFYDLFSRDEYVYSNYRTLVRTGRTSSHDFNIQQMPCDTDFRNLFIARPGHRLLAIDYAAIELRTLAVVCQCRFGCSVLLDVLKAGRDPHVYTAAMILGEDYDAVRAGVRREKESGKKGRYTEARQRAKVVNFGVPGGLGAAAFVAYAKAKYGVDMTELEAKRFKRRLIFDIYPELNDRDGYLADETLQSVARNLGVPPRVVCSYFGGSSRPGLLLSDVVRGCDYRGEPVSHDASVADAVWGRLAEIARKGSPTLAAKAAVEAKRPSQEAYRAVCGGLAATLTGRVRGGIEYTQIKNTPFQSLAADGAKLALFRLVMAGYRVVAFVHDEVVVELPITLADPTCEAAAADVDRIVREAMSEVLGGLVPVETEYKVAECWEKA